MAPAIVSSGWRSSSVRNGNPPFAGKNTIIGGNRAYYLDWLQTLHADAHGNADLSAHFYRRAFVLRREGGAFGLIATNTIRQGDTRDSGLRRIIEAGGTIFRAVGRHKWEGEAAVVVSLVFVAKGEREPAVLDGREVRRISAYLVEGDLDGSPATLLANAGKSFQGSILLGMGFTFDDVNAAKGKCEPLATMDRLIAEDLRNAEIIKPYLGGEEINNSPTHSHHRYAVDFFDRPLGRSIEGASWATLLERERQEQLKQGTVAHDYPHEVAADWPYLLQIVRTRVKPERDKQSDEGGKRLWWRYLRPREDMYRAIERLPVAIAINCGAQPHLAVGHVPTRSVLANTLAVFALSTNGAFANLQSRVHELWARYFASSMKDDLRYTPSDCFETFPLPPSFEHAPTLETAGKAYLDHRAQLMIARNQGMTATYNCFHDAQNHANEIVRLRELHAEMDRVVLAAYGWDDLAECAAPEFLTEEIEDDYTYQGRLFWPSPFRNEVLARLLRA